MWQPKSVLILTAHMFSAPAAQAKRICVCFFKGGGGSLPSSYFPEVAKEHLLKLHCLFFLGGGGLASKLTFGGSLLGGEAE